MRPQNIILLNGSHFINDMLERVISKTPGLQIVATVEDPQNISQTVNQVDADWIILTLQPDEEGLEKINELLVKDSSVHLMIIEAEGRRVKMKWFEPHEEELEKKDLSEILRILADNKPFAPVSNSHEKHISNLH